MLELYLWASEDNGEELPAQSSPEQYKCFKEAKNMVGRILLVKLKQDNSIHQQSQHLFCVLLWIKNLKNYFILKNSKIILYKELNKQKEDLFSYQAFFILYTL